MSTILREEAHSRAAGPPTNQSILINQGSYGCIYYPALPFKLQNPNSRSYNRGRRKISKEEDAKKYVSKLQKHNFHSEFEDYIGKKIQEIPSFDLFFVPVLTTHKIDLTTIKQKYVTDCEAIDKYIKRKGQSTITTNDIKQLNKHFIMQKMKYINGVYLHRHLQSVVSEFGKETSDSDSDDTDRHIHPNDHNNDGDDDDDGDASVMLSKTLRKDEQQIKKYRSAFKRDEIEQYSYQLMSIAFDLYERIMDSIQLLIQHKIVHYDLKENNILIEKIQQLPYIIDFGLSIHVERLLEHLWNEKKQQKQRDETEGTGTKTKTTIDSNVLYHPDSSKIFKDNYLWKQHFYIHAPDYYLWPLEVHLMTYLINENDTLTEESLRKICFEYIKHNRAIEYMSREFKKRMFDHSFATFSRFIDQPREKVLNELITYWDKWDMYAINIMFLKIMYELIFHIERDTSALRSPRSHRSPSPSSSPPPSPSPSQNEKRQHKLDPYYSSDREIEFTSKYKVKLKQKYNSYKIMNTLQVMLRNIHPNPDKRMTPQETKTFFVSIFYEC
jgi:serine/threonine protein kinase